MFDIDTAPAVELAALYHRRWRIEQSLDEFKVHLAARELILRSKRPERVEQEFHALLLAHAAIRKLMTRAAAATGQAAENLSFIHAVRVAASSRFRRYFPLSSVNPGSIASSRKSPSGVPSPAAASATPAA